MDNILKVKDRVRLLLIEEPETRSNDKLLTARYLQKYHNVVYITDILQSNIPPLESIRRSRQKLQENGDFLPPAIIILKRENEQEKYMGFNR